MVNFGLIMFLIDDGSTIHGFAGKVATSDSKLIVIAVAAAAFL